MKIFIVEDDLYQAQEIIGVIRKTLSENVQILGPFAHYKEALLCIQQNTIDLAILDIQLQEDRYAGVHLGENIELTNKTPILYVTGISDDKIIEQTKTIHNCNFISKPFDSVTLERALKRTLEQTNIVLQGEEDKISFKIGDRDKYWIKEGTSDYVGISINDIAFVEAKDHICEFNMIDGQILKKRTTLTKGVFEKTLIFYSNFYRLSRSFIINLDHIKNISGKRIMYPEIGKHKFIRIPDDQIKPLFNLIGLEVK